MVHHFRIVAAALILVACSTSLAALAKGNAKEGEKQFEKHQCTQCHLLGNNLIEPDKPLKGAKFAKKYQSDAQIAAVIRKGVPNTGMPPNEIASLPENELSDIIAYIRSLTPPIPAGTPAPLKKKQK